MIEKFRPGQQFGMMIDGRLVIGRAEADKLNAIAQALASDPLLQPAGGRARQTPGGLYVSPETPETFHARLTNNGPSYTWEEVSPVGSTYPTLDGGRSSEQDGNAREYNGATGLDDHVVLMQVWPNGLHRFEDSKWGIGGPPGPDPGPPCCPFEFTRTAGGFPVGTLTTPYGVLSTFRPGADFNPFARSIYTELYVPGDLPACTNGEAPGAPTGVGTYINIDTGICPADVGWTFNIRIQSCRKVFVAGSTDRPAPMNTSANPDITSFDPVVARVVRTGGTCSPLNMTFEVTEAQLIATRAGLAVGDVWTLTP